MNRTNMQVASYHIISPSQATEISTSRLMEKIMASLVNGNQSNLTGFRLAKPPTAATPSVLNIMEPRMVPTPMSDSVTKVLMRFVKSSGVVVATDMNVAAATS